MNQLKKCKSCHKKQAYKQTKDINKNDTYECGFCGNKHIPFYHNTNAKSNDEKSFLSRGKL